ncbi:hypothetical protein ABPG72_001465 [Tetrahymena utriculariae]
MIEQQNYVKNEDNQVMINVLQKDEIFRTNVQNIREYQKLIPSENDYNADSKKYRDALSKLQQEYDKFQQLLQRVSLFSQKTQKTLKNITDHLIEKLQTNQAIENKLLEDYQEDFKDIKSKYDEYNELYNNQINSIENIQLVSKLLQEENSLLKYDEKVSIQKLIQKQIEREINGIDEDIKKLVEQKEQNQENCNKLIADKNKSKEFNKESNQKIIEERSKIIQDLLQQKSELNVKQKENMTYYKDMIMDNFNIQQQNLKSSVIEQTKFFRIFIIDESGSMKSGGAF